MRYHLIDEGAQGEADLERRDALTALLFRLEGAPDPEQVVAPADAVMAWLARHPGFDEPRRAFTALRGAMMEPLGPGVRVPDEGLEVRNRLATPAGTWKQQWLQEGRREGRLEGEAALLVRLLERRFGGLPDWARDRIAADDTRALEEWGLRVVDAGSLDDAPA